MLTHINSFVIVGVPQNEWIEPDIIEIESTPELKTTVTKFIVVRVIGCLIYWDVSKWDNHRTPTIIDFLCASRRGIGSGLFLFFRKVCNNYLNSSNAFVRLTGIGDDVSRETAVLSRQKLAEIATHRRHSDPNWESRNEPRAREQHTRTYAAAAAMTGAEFRRRDACRARGSEVSTTVGASGWSVEIEWRGSWRGR